MSTQTLQIKGMTCGACVARVERALASVPGVDSCAVNLATNLATVSSSVAAPQLVDAVRAAGYDAAPIAEGAAASTLRKVAADQEEDLSRVRRRLLIGAAAAVPVFLIDLLHAKIAGLAPAAQVAFALVELLCATLILFHTGRPFFAGAFRALRHGAANMDVLVALGSGVAYLFSLYVTAAHLAALAGRHEWRLALHPEYHAAAAIIVLVTLGKYLEARAKRASNIAVAGLALQSAATASRFREDGTLESVPAEQIAVGDRLQILAHQPLPVDGALLEGSGSLDLSIITGESAPVPLDAAHPPAQLPAGARLLDGRIVIRAAATAATSTVARILSLVQSAQAGKTRIQSLADRIAAVFVPIVLFLAAAAFAAWFFTGHTFAQSLIPAIATVVIACPCAMGLATPTAVTVAVGVAARRGILFARADVLERVGRIGTIAFDKTGTLTTGTPRVTTVGPIESSGVAVKDLLQITASVEQFSEHPLALAILAAARADELALLPPASFSSSPGGGVRAQFADGREFAAGSAVFLRSLGVPADFDKLIFGLADRGETIVAVADLKSRRCIGVIGLKDSIRMDAVPAMAWIKQQGVRIAVLSGDTEAAVQGTLGDWRQIDLIRAHLRPEEKAGIIAQLKSDGRGAVAFVGDGINDAPALAAADLGIAMAAGSDLAKSAGDILLVGNRLAAIPEAWQLSRRTLRIIRQNLFWAFAYNVAAIPLAMLGVLPPAFAAGAMILSSLTVVLNALRLYRTSAWGTGVK